MQLFAEKIKSRFSLAREKGVTSTGARGSLGCKILGEKNEIAILTDLAKTKLPF